MSPEPARCNRLLTGSKLANTPSGGNLARALSTHAGHFLFPSQLPQQLEADFTNPDEAGLSSLPARKGAGAATYRQCRSAKSRPLPPAFKLFAEVNQVSHRVLPSHNARTVRTFRDGGKLFCISNAKTIEAA